MDCGFDTEVDRMTCGLENEGLKINQDKQQESVAAFCNENMNQNAFIYLCNIQSI